MKANFKELNVEIAFDVFQNLDVTRELGNYIHQHTADIGLDDVARAIYRSEGEVEIPDEFGPMIVAMVESAECPLVAGVKRAIINELKE